MKRSLTARILVLGTALSVVALSPATASASSSTAPVSSIEFGHLESGGFGGTYAEVIDAVGPDAAC